MEEQSLEFLRFQLEGMVNTGMHNAETTDFNTADILFNAALTFIENHKDEFGGEQKGLQKEIMSAMNSSYGKGIQILLNDAEAYAKMKPQYNGSPSYAGKLDKLAQEKLGIAQQYAQKINKDITKEVNRIKVIS